MELKKEEQQLQKTIEEGTRQIDAEAKKITPNLNHVLRSRIEASVQRLKNALQTKQQRLQQVQAEIASREGN
jgi:hypothetical protein